MTDPTPDLDAFILATGAPLLPRHPSEYMRPGMKPWTTAEREHVERVNERMADGWGDAYRERPDGGDDA